MSESLDVSPAPEKKRKIESIAKPTDLILVHGDSEYHVSKAEAAAASTVWKTAIDGDPECKEIPIDPDIAPEPLQMIIKRIRGIDVKHEDVGVPLLLQTIKLGIRLHLSNDHLKGFIRALATALHFSQHEERHPELPTFLPKGDLESYIQDLCNISRQVPGLEKDYARALSKKRNLFEHHYFKFLKKLSPKVLAYLLLMSQHSLQCAEC